MNFKIRNFPPIKECDMDIGKINIIAGPNASGKSNAGKLLYCFLKSISHKRQELAYDSISHSIKNLIGYNNLRDDSYEYENNLTDDSYDLLLEYEKFKEEYYSSIENSNRFIDKQIKFIDESLEEIRHNGDCLYLSILRHLLKTEFSKMDLSACISFGDEFISLEEILTNESIGKSLKPDLEIYDVFYIDSISIFDLLRHPDLENEDAFKEFHDGKKNKTLIELEERMERIIGGNFEFKSNEFIFNSIDGGHLSMQDTSSGIKQIGIIQSLLRNRRLREDSFLIMDNPDAGLHPEWQFKFAMILLLMAKDLNISIYLNVHSPVFIEAIEVLSKYYGLEDDAHYYLAESDNESNGKGYCFKSVDGDGLYDLYDDLANPYHKIDLYRFRSDLKRCEKV